MTLPDVTFTMTYSVNGEPHILNGFDTNTGYTFHLIEFSDVGLPPITRITQRGAFQHGETNIDYRINPRSFVIRGFVEANSTYEHMKVRDMLGKLFKVSNTASQLKVESTQTLTEPPYTEEIITRAIDCYVEGGINVSSDTSAGYSVFFDVQLRATNPFWYNPAESKVTLSNVTTGDPTDVPLLVPRTYGTIGINSTVSVPYAGTFRSFPIIYVYGGDGGITNLEIINNSALAPKFGAIQKNLSIRLYSVPAYSTFTIDLRQGYKTVKNQNGEDMLAYVDPSSNLTSFALFPTLEYGSNENILDVSGTSSTNAYVTMTYYTQYTSI